MNELTDIKDEAARLIERIKYYNDINVALMVELLEQVVKIDVDDLTQEAYDQGYEAREEEESITLDSFKEELIEVIKSY